MLILFALACNPAGNHETSVDTSESGDSAIDTAADTATDTAGDSAELPEPSTVYYFGTSTGQTPDGSYVEDANEILFIRTVDPASATITEEYWQEAGRKFDSGMLVHEVDVDTLTFTSTWDTGDGELDLVGGYDAGEVWAWTAWHSTSTYITGDYLGWTVTSIDLVDAAGADTANKSIFDETGTEIWRILEVISPTDQASFEERLQEI